MKLISLIELLPLLMVEISIIIPVFNSGSFLYDSVKSVRNSIGGSFEIILVDDGSTDSITIETLNSFSEHEVLILRKENGGPASARNLGVKHAKGDFLFFLDSDNTIRPDYLKRAIDVINNEEKIGVVYSKPNFIGDFHNLSQRFITKAFNFDSLLAGNYIDMCSLVRRQAFEDVGGFDESKSLIGWEDWDLWIRIANKGWDFHYIDQVLFDYRVRGDSLMGSADVGRRHDMLEYIAGKHGYLFHQKFRQFYRVMDKIYKKPLTYFFKILYYKIVLRKPFVK